MVNSEFDLTMSDGQNIHLYLWIPDDRSNLKGIVQIVHGAAEYGKRYEGLAKFLTLNGFVVCASDHRGHGYSVRDENDFGFFFDQKGWEKVTEDLLSITHYLKNRFNGLKVCLLGHSMGSFLARTYAVLYGNEINGLILSGTAHNPRPLLKFGKLVAAIDIAKGNARRKNRLLNKLVFYDLNKSFHNGKTDRDWISRDEAVVAEYMNDKLCGFDFTSSAFRDMFSGLLFITDKRNIAKTPKELPILILSGKEDPVGSKGKMVQKCYQKYVEAGISNIQLKLYEGMRHEILNETGKEEVYNDILNWLIIM
ncbi:MAG: lysophospholipase [Clostridiales bacterium]|nr:lysophospholipase [Clostridiales bacterium]